jgi:diacylglycerol O-acyltransferase-1
MATLTQMAASSALYTQQASSPVYRGKATTEPKANGATKRARDTKYRHVFATHSSSRTSCLSQDAEKTPSFVGFRNLMILVLSMNTVLPTIAAIANE